jgi:catechol 2,3-dioxygenase-like lactoylglutathione lyase family enzyme
MIGYTTLGTNDFEKAKTFYDKAFAALGARRTMTNDRMQGWGIKGTPGMFAVCKPYDGGKAVGGNGPMVAIPAPSQDVVKQVHADALAAGGKDEGAPGDRGGGFYGAYFRDLDGKKVCVFKVG